MLVEAQTQTFSLKSECFSCRKALGSTPAAGLVDTEKQIGVETVFKLMLL